MRAAPNLSATLRADLERAILGGAWPPGARIPTEHALMAQYGCARMTINKVLAGLADRGLIVRRRRLGSFVAQPTAEQTMLTIADFAAEAARAGRQYRHVVDALVHIPAPESGAFVAGEPLLHVVCRHFFDHLPIALEDRLVRIASVPAIEGARFRTTPPGPWLLRHVPWSEAEHDISAATASADLADSLAIAIGAAVLWLRRRTWHAGTIVTDARFAFPAERYRFTGRFAHDAK